MAIFYLKCGMIAVIQLVVFHFPFSSIQMKMKNRELIFRLEFLIHQNTIVLQCSKKELRLLLLNGLRIFQLCQFREYQRVNILIMTIL